MHKLLYTSSKEPLHSKKKTFMPMLRSASPPPNTKTSVDELNPRSPLSLVYS